MAPPSKTRLAAYGLIHDRGQLLLCRLSRQVPLWSGFWVLPGGGVDFGEDPEDAVRREVAEETGLIVAVDGVLFVNSVHEAGSNGRKPFHGVRIVYRARVMSGVLRPEPSGTTDQCAWQPLHGGPPLPLVDLAVAGRAKARDIWPA